MTKAETLQILDDMSSFYFLIEERGYTREEAAAAIGLKFDPTEVDNWVFVQSTAVDSDE